MQSAPTEGPRRESKSPGIKEEETMFKVRVWPLLLVVGFSCVAHGQLDFATYLDRSSPNGLWAGAYNFDNDGVGDQAFRSQQGQPAMRLGPHGTEQTIFTYLNSSNDLYVFLDDDGDGDTDVIVARKPHLSPTGGIKRIECNGDGTFAPSGPLGTESAKITKFLTFDADGDVDLATPNYLYVNDSTGFLTEMALPLAGLIPVDSGDVDNDGDLDLLCAGVRTGGNYVVVLRKQTGALAYTTEVIFGAPSSSAADWSLTRPTLQDLDGDGDLDVLTLTKSATANSADLLIWENTGPTPGGFTQTFILTVPFADFMVNRVKPEVLDFDDDGIIDIRVGELRLKGTGANALSGFQFVAPIPFQFGPSVPTFDFDRLLDLDLDGDFDLLGDRISRNEAHSATTVGRYLEYGLATQGSGGFRPVLSAQGPFVTGSSTAKLRISRGVGQTGGTFALGTQRLNLLNFYGPELHLYVGGVFSTSPITLGGNLMESGAGFLDLPFTIPPFLAGATYYMQVGLVDPNGSLGFTATNGLELQFGQ